MREMQNIEYSYIVRELQQMEGRHFSKIYSLGEKFFRLKIGDMQVIIELPLRVGIAKYISKAEEGTNFTRRLKKILDNQMLMRAYQCGKDRIVAFEFEKNILFLEMFAKGNIILTDKNGKIAEALREEKWKDRALAKGEGYREPKSEITEELEKTLSGKYAIVCLLRLPLGKEYAKEMLERCRIDEKKQGDALSQDEISCLKREYENILHGLRPLLFLENNKVVDYALVKFAKYANLESREMPSLSEAMEEYYTNAPEQETRKARQEQLGRRLKEQMEMLEKLKMEGKDAKEKGDFIYANYRKIEEIVEIAKKAGMNELSEALRRYKVLAIDGKKKEIELEL